MLFLLAAVGDLLWDSNVPRNVLHVVVGDFDGDGQKDDIAVGTAVSTYAKVYAYRGDDGTLLWENDEDSPLGNLTGSVISMDTVPDIDGDGKDDVAVVTYKPGETPICGVLGSSTGEFVWKKNTPNGKKINVIKTVKRTDGEYQVVIGTTNYSGAEVFAYNVTDGSAPSGWTDYNAAGSVYVFAFGSLGGRSGVLAIGRATGTEIRVINATTGAQIDTDGTPDASVKFLKLVDYDGDSQNELLVTSQDNETTNVFIYELSGSTLSNEASANLSSNGTANCADVVGDLTGDGYQEVVVGTEGKVWLLSGSDFSVIDSYDLQASVNSIVYIGNSYVVVATEGAGSGNYELWIFTVSSSGFSLENRFDLLDNTSDGINELVAFDPDNDGNLDFALVSDNDGSINEVQVRKGYVPANQSPVLSWVGGIYYEGVRATDRYKTNGALRSFGVNYTDPEGDAPFVQQVLIDMDRDGSYSGDESFNMSTSGSNFAQNVTFTASVQVILSPDKSYWYYNGSEYIANTTYRFYFKDSAGNSATGEPTNDHYIYFQFGGFSLNPISGTGPYANYVDPDSDYNGASFTFKVSFFGEAGVLPDNVTLIIDADCDTDVDPGELYLMNLESQNYDSSTGWIYANYTATVNVNSPLTFVGSTDISFNITAYIFENHTISSNVASGNFTLLANNPPVVSFVSIEPQTGDDGESFSFVVNYTDADNQAPSSVILWVDKNDNGAKDAGETLSMSQVNSSDTNYTDGALYQASLTLYNSGDGNLTVSVQATDSVGGTSLEVFSWVYVAPPVSGNRPSLYFVEGFPEGVYPQAAYSGVVRTFKVGYKDPDGTNPEKVQLWLDLNDDGTYQSSEKFDMAKESGQIKTGAIYSISVKIDYAGDGSLKYKFYAVDPYDGVAEGEPAFNRELIVLKPIKGDLEVFVLSNKVVRSSGEGGHAKVILSSGEKFQVEVYTLKGVKVFSSMAEGEFSWDGRSSSGVSLPPGIYLIYVKSISSGRFAVVPVKVVVR